MKFSLPLSALPLLKKRQCAHTKNLPSVPETMSTSAPPTSPPAKQPVKKDLSTTTPPPTNSSTAYISAIVLAAFLAFFFFFAHFPLSIFEWLQPYGLAMRYFAFPLFAFLASLATNVLIQHVACGSIRWDEASMASGYFLLPLYAGLLAGTFGKLRSPIASLFKSDEKCGRLYVEEKNNPAIIGAGKAYWVFFGALVGQILAGSMAAVC